MERFVYELTEMYRIDTLKTEEELEYLKYLIRNAYREGFIAGEESMITIIDGRTK